MIYFRYWDNKQNAFLFSCLADDIAEADKLFYKHLNLKPQKNPYVGCQVSNYQLGMVVKDWSQALLDRLVSNLFAKVS